MSVVGNINTRQTSIPFSVPAPVGGLNGRDPLADMDPRDAYLLDNLYPQANKIVARGGTEKHTGAALEAAVETLETYTGASGEKMLAWAGTKCYDVSTPTSSELETGLTEPYVQTTMFSNASDNAQHLIVVNGADTPRHYDGSTMSTLSMTGITTPADLNNVFTFKGRLYFAAKDMLGFYYLPLGQIQGALTYFDLGQVSRRGGHLVAMASYSQGGDTPNDYIVFITSTGELIVYSGTDPSDAAAWSLVGRYYAASPIGKKCSFNFNGELIILTLDGAVPFSLVRKQGDAEGQGVLGAKFGAITTKLGRYLSDFNQNASVNGWQGIQYPKGGYLLVNVPATSSATGDYYHYVMNANTGSWARYTNWNGLTFTIFNDDLYFGRNDGHVMKADVGAMDDGDPIEFNVKQAYSYFNQQNDIEATQKHFRWAELFVASNGTPPLNGSFSVDFQEREPSLTTGIAPPDGAEWDTATWDVAEWGATTNQRTAIITLNRGGSAGSLWLRASLNGISFEWFSTQYVIGKTMGLLG